MIGWLAVRAIVGLAAIGGGVHIARWRRRSRADWHAYDAAHGEDPRSTRASLRARRG